VAGLLMAWPLAGAAGALGNSDATAVKGNKSFPAAPPAEVKIPDAPSARDITSLHLLPEPLVPSTPAPAVEQNQLLADALRHLSQRIARDDFSALEEFVSRNPDSPWTPSVLFNLGLSYYKTGWYSKAISSFEQAWTLSKSSTDPGLKAVADDDVGELALMYARVGRMHELSDLMDSINGRVLRGPGNGKIASAKQGLWTMQHTPEIAFRCGPLALDRIIALKNPGKGGQLLIENSGSTTNGFALSQVAELSRKAGLNYRMAYRAPGSPLLMPAVVHWKVGHYAALLKEKAGLYLLQDLTFRNDAWVSARALDHEASGYFLVPPGPLPTGWRSVSQSEGMNVWGKGQTSSSDPNNNTPDDKKKCPDGSQGMAVASVYLLDVSLNIQDTPLGYTPPVGPSVPLVINYNQLESDQPAVFNYSNLGAQWTFNYLAFITDDPGALDSDVNYYTDGGGTLPFTGFDPTTQTFASQLKSQAVLSRTSSTSYQMLFRNGSKYIFALPETVSATSRRVFLTQMIDAQGNSIQITYDGSFRVVAITDAIGQITTLSYQNPSDSLKITKATDPFGRFATFQYDSSNRLAQITDCIGLVSQFTYDAGDNILAMTTPYGTTRFAFGVSTDYTGRGSWLETTYPNGEKDRVEYSEASDVGTVSQDPASTLPQGMWTRDWVIYGRDTYYWDRNAYQAYAANPTNYTAAYNYHWLHDQSLSTAMGVLESEKATMENRVWYNYAGQPDGNYYATILGTSDQPTLIGRVLDDGTTKLRKFGYDMLGHITNSIDPLGRSMTYVYSTNMVDLLEIRQTTGTKNELLAKYVYNAQHLPVATFDSAGQLTTNTYNARGQLLSSTNPKGEITSLSYDANGYLLSITGPLQTPSDTTNFTYDSFGRIRTMTDTSGYALSYSYDNLNRITNITHPDGTFEAFTYSNLDLVITRDRLGRQTTSTYDALRRRVAMQDPQGRVTQFQYCGCGSLAALIDPMGHRTEWDHDLQGRLTAKVYDDGSRITYTYEQTTSRLKSVVDEKGQAKIYTYNADDTVSNVSYPNATVPTTTVSFGYDPNYRRVVSMQDAIGTTIYTYNPVTSSPSLGAGRVASVGGPLPNSLVTYQYDELGRPISRAINGVAQAITYDVLNRPIIVTNILGTFQYGYVGATPRLALESYPNGQKNNYSYYGNAGDNRLLQVDHLKPGGALLSGAGYAYDAVGQITSWTNQWDTLPTRVWQAVYDQVDQLAGVTGSIGPNYSYAYDLAGNRVMASANNVTNLSYYNSLNQLESSLTGNTNLTYEWDPEGHLTAINHGTGRSEFSYDGWGRRTQIVEKTNGVVATRNYYLWCDNEICEVRDATGGTVQRRLLAQGESLTGSSGTTNYYYTFDHLGSVREALGSTGAIAARYDYDPYGLETVYQQNVVNTVGYAGLFSHPPTGLLLSSTRTYNPNLGRWLSRDPLGENSGFNLYDYVANNPLVLFDPAGLQPPTYNPNYWNDQGTIQYGNNCYSYSLNRPGPRPVGKPQPGDFSGNPYQNLTCADIAAAAMADGTVGPDAKGCCPKGYHKVQLVLAPGVDYHWYRQDQGGNWSHKPGWGQATNVDASGNPISDPTQANRDYSPTGGPNYNVNCGRLCAPD
jgi:RHS repeat-associated protein